MSNQQSKHGRIAEIKEFFQFLGGVFGILSAISVFFPYLDLLVRALPVADEYFSFFSAFTSIVCAYAMLHTYSSRDDFLKGDIFSKTNKRNMHSKATNLLVSAIFFAIIFFILTLRYSPSLSGSLSLQTILLWSLSFILYLLVFANITRGFTFLALSEYMGQRYAKLAPSTSDPQLKKKPQDDYSLPLQGQKQKLSFESLDGLVPAAFIEDQIVRNLNNFELVKNTSVKFHKSGGKVSFLLGRGNKKSNASYARKVDKVTVDIEITRLYRSHDLKIRRYTDKMFNELAEQHGLLFSPHITFKS